MRLLISFMLIAATGCHDKRPQHAARLSCDQPDVKPGETGGRQEAMWCAAAVEDFLAKHPDVELENVSVYVEHIGEKDFASMVLLYRGEVAIKGSGKPPS